jgi:hypothetical protein
MVLSMEDIMLGPERQCRVCEEMYRSMDIRQTTCGPNCSGNGARKAKSEKHEVEFIGIDGEGVGRGKAHKYILMGCGTNQYDNPEGIRWESALQFLYESYRESPQAAYVGFYLGYDFCQIFKSLPEGRARCLFTTAGMAQRKRTASGGNPVPFPVRIRGEQAEWEVDQLPTLRRIKLRPVGEKGWLYVCDAGPFFQTSFLNVIDPRKWQTPVVSQAEFDLIKEGKERRATAELDADMRKYMALEIDVLARVMNELNRGLVKANVRLKRQQWFGPGQAAQAWMSQAGVPKSEEYQKAVPKYARDAARLSYFGGWFELMCHGYIEGKMYEYDINSAYPYIISKLPCLLHGRWSTARNANLPEGGFTLVHAIVRGSDPYVGAMLHRNLQGNILRPYTTSGWYWLHELRGAERAGIIDEIIPDEWVNYEPCTCKPPIRGIRGLYDNRLAIGKNSAQGKAYKLIYNSDYGKFAQSVGDPVFGNAIYASLITAGCRTQILDAIATHPEGSKAVAMVATDGVYFLSRHPTLSLGEALGEWEETEHDNMTLFKPGVYWDDKAREAIRLGNSAVFKARGVNARSFSRVLSRIDDQFNSWQGGLFPTFLNVPGGPKDKAQLPGSVMGEYDVAWPKVKFPLDFAMHTVGQALAWKRWYVAGQVLNHREVIQDSDPITKRAHRGFATIDGRVIRTKPHARGTASKPGYESEPYKKRFGEPLELSIDGPIETMIFDALKGG